MRTGQGEPAAVDSQVAEVDRGPGPEGVTSGWQAPDHDDVAVEFTDELHSKRLDDGDLALGPEPDDVLAAANHENVTDGSQGATTGAALPEPAADAETLKEVEPWAMAASEPLTEGIFDAVATALERVAARMRNGEVPLLAERPPASDEEALALTLAALLRSPPQ